MKSRLCYNYISSNRRIAKRNNLKQWALTLIALGVILTVFGLIGSVELNNELNKQIYTYDQETNTLLPYFESSTTDNNQVFEN